MYRPGTYFYLDYLDFTFAGSRLLMSTFRRGYLDFAFAFAFTESTEFTGGGTGTFAFCTGCDFIFTGTRSSFAGPSCRFLAFGSHFPSAKPLRGGGM